MKLSDEEISTIERALAFYDPSAEDELHVLRTQLKILKSMSRRGFKVGERIEQTLNGISLVLIEQSTDARR